MKKFVLCVVMGTAGMIAQAGGQATVTCGDAKPGVYNNGKLPVLNIEYAPGGDAGTPGLFWLGVLTPDEKTGIVLTEDKGWMMYEGGLYPFKTRYVNGLPGKISMVIPFPDKSLSTAAYAGYSVYVGHGAYTTQAQQTVAARRNALNSAKPELVKKGRWNSYYESDDQFIWSLVQKNMTDNQKYGPIIALPLIDCTCAAAAAVSLQCSLEM